MPVRNAKRRGHGWLAGYADIGWSNNLGWYEGFSLLTAVDPSGVITGFCFGPASTADQAETFFNVRADPNPRLKSVGSTFSGTYVADKGFEGVENRQRWLECHGADLIYPPKRNSKKRIWSKRLGGPLPGDGPFRAGSHARSLRYAGLPGSRATRPDDPPAQHRTPGEDAPGSRRECRPSLARYRPRSYLRRSRGGESMAGKDFVESGITLEVVEKQAGRR